MLTVQVEPATGKKQVLKLEVAVLRKLQGGTELTFFLLQDSTDFSYNQDSPHAAKFVHCGRQQDYNYLVMEHLGQNLNELRRKMPNGEGGGVTNACLLWVGALLYFLETITITGVFSLGTTARLGRQLLRAIKVGYWCTANSFVPIECE